ncbi:MAG: ribonuclease R [Saprospiraceae bacterium]
MTKNKKTKVKGALLRPQKLQSEILRLFKRHQKKPFNAKQIIRKLKIDNSKDSVQSALMKLVEGNQLQTTSDYKFKLGYPARSSNKAFSTYEGKVDLTRTGAAYIIVPDLEHDIYVAAKHTKSAMHGDKVKVKAWLRHDRRKMEGEIEEILERARESFIGTIHLFPKHAIVTTDGMGTPLDIFVALENTKGSADGEKVTVKIINWERGPQRDPEGKVMVVLGEAGSHDIEMKAILINKGFDLIFSEEALAIAEKLPTAITEEEISLRRDMREVTTFTIDPDTAKDFDDALSIQFLDNGHCEIGVHIADVAHYVLPGTALDKEAFQRSTSVYLVDRVLPMLPERLSNELCSLRPHEDKLTFSAVFVFDKNDKVQSRWFGRTIIHSNHRFTYEEAQAVLESEGGPFESELKLLNRIALKLRQERFKQGSINFETQEVKFRLDDQGTPLEVYVKERKDSNMLIEDFMLLANREVATYIHKKGIDHEIPFVYRIHDEPDPDRVEEFARFAREFGFEMDISSKEEIARSYNRLVKASEKIPALKLLEPIAIRTMAKAAYSTENIGHYGLGFEYYSHFTSPIRRYSDILAHRILALNLGKGESYRVKKEALEEECRHISQQERKAMDAERESVKYKQVEFIEKHLGETFEGYVSGLSDYGIYVVLKANHCEGMVSYNTLPEPFELASSRLKITGLRSGQTLKMGDNIWVKIVDTDLNRRRIDMAWADVPEES